MPGEDDERGAVADPARRDLLAEPDEEHRAAGQRDDRRNAEQQPRIADDARPPLKSDRDAIGLKHREDDGEVARVLIEDLAARLALFLDGLQRRHHRAQKLDDDRSRNVGHDVEREHRHPLHGAARKHVEHVEHALPLAEEGGLEGLGIDARKRDIGAETVDHQSAQREPDALLEFVGLRRRRTS